jgi:Zn finger protein HypA/HybF involved in hydrogenase expression
MDLQKQTCVTKTVLTAAWQSAADVYAQTVAELSRRIGTLSKAEYDRLSRAAENARKHSQEAQATLEVHIAEHGCGNNGEAAA